MPYTGTLPSASLNAAAGLPAAWTQQVAGALQALGGAWSSYTPAVTGSVSNPTLGTGASQSGRYMQVGKTAIVRAAIAFGTAGVAVGSGAYYISLPATITPVTGAFAVVGTGYYFDSSATAYTPVIARTTSTGLLIELMYPATWPNGAVTNVGSTAPAVPAASDQFGFNIVLEAQ